MSADKAARLLQAATATFIERGFRRTQVADVAIVAGVGKATVYGYVKSKEALFDWALQHADAPETLDLKELPWPTPGPGVMVTRLAQRLEREMRGAALVTELAADRATRAGLERILLDLFERSARNRVAIRLVDRCAADQPEIAALWFDAGRWAQVDMLAEYMRRTENVDAPRTSAGRLIAARFAIETIALWAVHRHWDPAPQALDEETVATHIVALLLGGLLTE